MRLTRLTRPSVPRQRTIGVIASAIGIILWMSSVVLANHKGHLEQHDRSAIEQEDGAGHAIPGLPFRVFTSKGHAKTATPPMGDDLSRQSVQTVVDALTHMGHHQEQYPRFKEALKKHVLQKVVIEPKVFNREGKEFFFLVARTKQQGQVKLLINASTLQEQEMLNHPDKLVPVLAREFQWVVSKADTRKKRKAVSVARNLKQAPIQTNKAIRSMPAKERGHRLQALLQSYLTTVDAYGSLQGQRYYDVDSPNLLEPVQPDSTMKYYDIRVREALQIIVQDPHFQQQTPKAVRSLLNGKVWNVSFVNIESRDWATRTRVLPQDKAVLVGPHAQSIQPAKILINLHRKAEPEDPFYSDTQGLPMGALSTNQLARVIAIEIHNNIVEKSMRGHVAQDETTAPEK